MRRNRGLKKLDIDLDKIVEKAYEAERPPVLYHYTTWGGLEGILSTRKLWVTAHHCTNDPAELASTDSVALDVARELVQACSLASKVVPERFIDRFLRDQLRDKVVTYLACFSSARDKMSQWEKYADRARGVCLGIRLLQGQGEGAPDEREFGKAWLKVDYCRKSWERKHRELSILHYS